MDIKNIKTISVAGWGKTGIALTKLLLSLGKKVKVSEQKERNDFSLSLIDEFQAKGVKFEFGKHSKEFVGSSELIISSPGVDIFNSDLGKAIKETQIPYLGELEFSSYFTNAKIIAVTGTNGKTTTASLLYQLLKKKGKKVYLGGNIGRPFSEFVLQTTQRDLIILEVSSFQLETIITFRPYVAVLLNIEPDHLDRHKNFSNYFKTKMKIFQNQQKNDWAVVNKKNNLFKNHSFPLKSKITYFDNEFSDENLSAAYKVGRIFGATRDDCLRVFSQYKKLPHRQQFIKSINKINFINDSKATNPASTFFALNLIKSPVILIAGGKDKGFSYSPLANYSRKIKKANLIGETAEKISKKLTSKIKCQQFGTLREAVFCSYKEAVAGDTILFSPMCSSFDMFADYKARGLEFIKIVNSI